VSKTEPDAALKDRPAAELQPGDEAKLRNLAATFALPGTQAKPVEEKARATPPSAAELERPRPAEPAGDHGEDNLLHLFLASEYGFWMTLLAAAGLGAVHALTPGHGKTLVAAYLVGQRGTVWHALLLGLVTTLTHTGVVFAVAVSLLLFYPQGKISEQEQQDLQMILGLVGGLLVTFLGFWLLLRRLSGRADHIHIGGHGHHHHHGPGGHHHHDHGHADHFHDEHSHAHPVPAGSEPVGWWGLIVLGATGGLVPCWDAVAILLLAVGANLLWLALPVLLAFSAGLAGVLVLVGVLVVHAKGFAGSHFGEGRLFRALPVLSAVVVTVVGLYLCYDSVHGRSAEPKPAAGGRPG
jgi:ABC-type nickel/cobalt efflux system permease component RcnA